MKYRIKFEKGQNVKFLGHLDLLRTFQKTIKRSEIPIKYSEGFNPRQITGFAQPLSVGVTSSGEYMDIETVEDVAPEWIVNQLNANTPEGIQALGARELVQGEGKAMTVVEVAKYIVTIEDEVTADTIEKFMKQTSILIMKKTKKGMKEAEIREGILSMEAEGTKLALTLSAGSILNIKVNHVIEALYKFMGKEYDEYKIDIHRVGLYKWNEKEIVDL